MSERSRVDRFEASLVELGFRAQGASRRGGRMWVLPWSAYLAFVLHDYGEAVVLTWSVALGDYLTDRGWQLGITDTSTTELYPQADVRLPRDPLAVEGELRRVLGTLRIDLGAPST